MPMLAHNSEPTLKTPVLFVIFNRPAVTQKVFEAIRKARPEKLFIASDGPRDDRPGEAEKCDQARKIATAVDWPCEVKTLFHDRNVGCGRNVSGGITWFFSHVEQGIILEDDCLPADSFFPYCSILLERYRTDNRIMAVSGCNMLFENQKPSDASYFFSNHNYIWGWATWKRAWQLFDFELKRYSHLSEKEYFKHYHSLYEAEYINYVMRKTYRYNEQISWWGYQWDFARKIHSGLVIVPKKNVVMNLGIGPDSTHTARVDGPGSHLKLQEMELPLVHPQFVMVDSEYDNTLFKNHYTTRVSRAKTLIRKFVPQALLDWREEMKSKPC